jgi:hypothetical protein
MHIMFKITAVLGHAALEVIRLPDVQQLHLAVEDRVDSWDFVPLRLKGVNRSIT